MKLLRCLNCNDIFALGRILEYCSCDLSFGYVAQNGLTAHVYGPCKVLGMRNPDLLNTIPGNDYNWWEFKEPVETVIRGDLLPG